MATYELPLDQRPVPETEVAAERPHASLSEPVLTRNVLAFCRLRWIVVMFLIAFGLTRYIAPGLMERLGLVPPTSWPFITAAVLAVANLGFRAHALALAHSPMRHAARINLWTQILFDLVILTVVVHFVGVLETPIAFAYLFHIVLACIFLSRTESLIATLIASMLYVGCVISEVAGVVSHGSILADKTFHRHLEAAPNLAALVMLSVLAIWVIVWYLTSQLSAIVRHRDFELTEANRRLREAQEEKTAHMLRTTHELKAPFAAIHANTELLLKGYCGPLSDEVREVLNRIAVRCRRLATEIQEMLHLAQLRTSSQETFVWRRCNLADLLTTCISQVRAPAEERDVQLEIDLAPATVAGVVDHLQLFFSNLLSNAVIYSNRGGRVWVTCRWDPPDGPVVTIADEGIGIATDKLPHIFEEYYRTDEAVRHNKGSTGLGLTIVRHVALTHRIAITVESEPGQGTTFTLRFPATASGEIHE